MLKPIEQRIYLVAVVLEYRERSIASTQNGVKTKIQTMLKLERLVKTFVLLGQNGLTSLIARNAQLANTKMKATSSIDRVNFAPSVTNPPSIQTLPNVKYVPLGTIKMKRVAKDVRDAVQTHSSPTTEPLLITTTKHLIAYSAAAENFQKLVLKIAKVAKQGK